MIEVKELPQCKFGPIQAETFCPLVPVIAGFAEARGMGLERSFDTDPLMTEACYFLTWKHPVCGGCFIRISAADPLTVSAQFRVATGGWKSAGWDYSAVEGPERLHAILAQAVPEAERCRRATLSAP